MKKQTQLLSALALSVGLLSRRHFRPSRRFQARLPIRPSPQSGSNAGKSASGSGERTVEGTASQGQKIPEEFKKFFGMIYRINLHNPSKV